jgi:hypothetical protein
VPPPRHHFVPPSGHPLAVSPTPTAAARAAIIARGHIAATPPLPPLVASSTLAATAHVVVVARGRGPTARPLPPPVASPTHSHPCRRWLPADGENPAPLPRFLGTLASTLQNLLADTSPRPRAHFLTPPSHKILMQQWRPATGAQRHYATCEPMVRSVVSIYSRRTSPTPLPPLARPRPAHLRRRGIFDRLPDTPSSINAAPVPLPPSARQHPVHLRRQGVFDQPRPTTSGVSPSQISGVICLYLYLLFFVIYVFAQRQTVTYASLC